jgi:DNA-binding NarL/FixJ family response regulator
VTPFGPALRSEPTRTVTRDASAPAAVTPLPRRTNTGSADAYARYGGLGLTSTQSHVLALMAEGRTNREIATELQITQDQATHRVQDVLSVLRARRHAPAIAS